MSLAKVNALFCFFVFFCVLSCSCFAEVKIDDLSFSSDSPFVKNNNSSSFDSFASNSFQNAELDQGNDSQLVSVPAFLQEKAKDENSIEEGKKYDKEEEGKKYDKEEEEKHKKLINEEDLQLSFLDTLLDMLSVLDSFSDYYFGEENLDEDSNGGGKGGKVVNLRAANENDDINKEEGEKKEEVNPKKIDEKNKQIEKKEENSEKKKESLSDKLEKVTDKELEELLNSYVDSSASSLFSSLFPFYNDEDNEEYNESLSSSFSSLSGISDYFMGMLNFSSLPYFFDTMFAPLVGILYRNNDMLGRITTAIDEKEKICIVNVDMADLPSTAIMQTEVENDGTVMIYFSNGQTILSEGEKNISSSLLLSSPLSEHSNLRADSNINNEKKKVKNNNNDDDKSKVENIDENKNNNSKIKTSSFPYISTPDTISAVYSTSTFSLDDRCDASSDEGKAIIDNKILILKFPLKNKTIDDEGIINNNAEKIPKFSQKIDKNNNTEKDIDKVYENDKLYMKSVQKAEEEIIKQLEEDEKFKEEYDNLIKKREQLVKSGPIIDPLYMDQEGIAKKKHIVPFVRVEEF